MDFSQLKKSLASRVAPVYLCYGADHYLVYKAVDLVRRGWPDAEYVKFATTETPEAVVAAAQTTSFFGERRVVVYELTEKLNVTAFKQYLTHPTPETVILLLFFNEKHNFRLPGAEEVNCNPLPESTLLPLIARQIQPYTITPDAAQYLIAATGGLYSEIDNELTKLLAFYPKPQLLELKHLVPYLSKTTDYQIYELGSAILQKNLASAEKILAALTAGSTNDYVIFAGVAGQIRRAYYATATTGADTAVAKVLGCSPYAIKYSRRDFGRDKAGVRAQYARVLDLEAAIKSGRVSPLNAVAALIYR